MGEVKAVAVLEDHPMRTPWPAYGPFPQSPKLAKEMGCLYYFSGKPCKRNHLSIRQLSNRACIECQRLNVQVYINSEKGKSTRAAMNASPAIKAKKVIYQQSAAGQRARQRSLQTEKDRRAAGDRTLIDARSAACAKWRKAHREEWNEYNREYRQSNPAALVRNRLQSRLHRFIAQTRKQKELSFQEYTDCTPDDLVKWLETNFDDGMNWDNSEEWHIDHIRPCSKFKLTRKEEQKVCFNWRNLCALWAVKNLSKQDKYTADDEAKWVKHMRRLGYEGELYLYYH